MEQFTPPPGEPERVVKQYGDMLYRLCLVALGSRADAEDAVQDTLLRYLQKAPAFASREHEKAWLLRVAANRCRDLRRFRLRHPHTGLEEVAGRCAEPGDRTVLEALMSLPEKFRVVLLLHYVEGLLHRPDRPHDRPHALGGEDAAAKGQKAAGTGLWKGGRLDGRGTAEPGGAGHSHAGGCPAAAAAPAEGGAAPAGGAPSKAPGAGGGGGLPCAGAGPARPCCQCGTGVHAAVSGIPGGGPVPAAGARKRRGQRHPDEGGVGGGAG